MNEIKKNIMYILTIIGTSCGVIGGWTICLQKAIEQGDQFLLWCSILTVGGMLYGLGIWSANLIIEIKRYFAERKLAKGVLITPKIRFLSNTAIVKVDEKEKSKQKGDKNVSQNK